MTSSAVKPKTLTQLRAFERIFAWVSVAPFGLPVVPEVYRIIAGSLTATGTGSRTVANSALSAGVSKEPPASLSPGENLAMNRTVLHRNRRGCHRRQTSTAKAKVPSPRYRADDTQLSTRQQRIQRNTNRTRSQCRNTAPASTPHSA